MLIWKILKYKFFYLKTIKSIPLLPRKKKLRWKVIRAKRDEKASEKMTKINEKEKMKKGKIKASWFFRLIWASLLRFYCFFILSFYSFGFYVHFYYFLFKLFLFNFKWSLFSDWSFFIRHFCNNLQKIYSKVFRWASNVNAFMKHHQKFFKFSL